MAEPARQKVMAMDFERLAAVLTVLEKIRQYPALDQELYRAASEELQAAIEEAKRSSNEKATQEARNGSHRSGRA